MSPRPNEDHMTTATQYVDRLTATIPDFPTPGILFRDLTPVFADADAFRAIIDELAARFEGRFDAVAGVEARGFLLAAAVAYATHTRLVPIRKAGKLPGEVLREDYGLEYGAAALELRTEQLPAGTRVLILDDVLATGGSCGAAVNLIERAGYEVAGLGLVLELEGLPGRASLSGRDVFSIATAPA
ncbi:Adenine phosphoribosyltransferase [Plantibacter sp. T3]|uniref:Adenine phosphoribosyltransferase n=2 Tax=Microbacteriaceae TaxID=85023 RepID=A0ABY1LRC9_9MICO|nr:Adenine phosphoribosyltransferase [Plantibacter cousiniae]SKC72962.1 adenine phosphoribosyltransferase [Plantibacter cousiniae]VXC31810.1 Adenine phosphoribosyltransferase [Plantibacter sp. T3]